MYSKTAPEPQDSNQSENTSASYQSESPLRVTPLQTRPQHSSPSVVVPLIERNVSEDTATGETSNSSQSSASQNKETASSYPSSIQFGTLPSSGVPNILDELSSSSDSRTVENITSSDHSLQPSTTNKAPCNGISYQENNHVTVVATQSQHPMITRSKVGTVKPNPCYVLFTVTSTPTEPRTVTEALKHPGWNGAMTKEMVSFDETYTVTLVPYQPDMHILGCRSSGLN